MDERVSREVKAHIAKDIVNAYIRAAVDKQGENSRLTLSPDDVCNMFRQVYNTVDETLPNQTRKVGLS